MTDSDPERARLPPPGWPSRPLPHVPVADRPAGVPRRSTATAASCTPWSRNQCARLVPPVDPTSETDYADQVAVGVPFVPGASGAAHDAVGHIANVPKAIASL